MQVAAEIAVVPLGTTGPLSDYIAACERVLEEAGLAPRLHALATEVAGDWDTVMTAVRRCQETVHDMGAQRVIIDLKLATRTDRAPDLDSPVENVRRKLGG